MQDQPTDMTFFVKALSDAERLRVVGILARQPADAQKIAAELGIPLREAFQHLAHLAAAGIVREQEGAYELDIPGLEQFAREQFAAAPFGDAPRRPRDRYIPAPELDAQSRKVLATFLNADGTIRQIPLQEPVKLAVLLNYLIEAFTPGAIYTEKEVNVIIRRFNVDVSGLRRDLVDAGLLARERDGSKYWRPEAEAHD